MIRAVSAARRRLGISMMPRALYENRQARTCRSASCVVDQQRRLEPSPLADRLDELGMVGQERLRVGQGREPVLVDPRPWLPRPGRGQDGQNTNSDKPNQRKGARVIIRKSPSEFMDGGPCT